MASSSTSPCTACKLLRWKCVPGCVFAPYFREDDLARFRNVHKVFGARNVAKILNGLPPASRRDAVTSICMAAAAQLQDPVQGCLGYIPTIQYQLQEIRQNNAVINAEIQAFQLQASLEGVTLPPPMPTALEPQYHPPQITSQQVVLHGGYQHERQSRGFNPHRQLGTRDSGGGPSTELTLATQQYQNPVHHHPYHQEHPRK